jgi:predicted site-specific integrase-resolvase
MAQKRIKLSQFAKEQDIAYATAYRHWQAGHIKGIQLPGGTILVEGWSDDGVNENREKQLAIIYSRVNSVNKKAELKTRTAELTNFALEQGYEIIDVIEEIGSGFSDRRTKLLNILHRTDWDVLVAENEGQLFKFGFPYIEVLLKQNGREIQFISGEDEDADTLGNIEINAEFELVSLFRRVKEFIKPIVGHQSSKRTIDQHIESLLN